MLLHVALRLSRRAALNLWRAPLPSLVSVLTIGLALFLGTTFVLGLLTARALLRGWGAQATLTLYLDPKITDAEAKALALRIPREEPGFSASWVTRDQALQRLRGDLGDLASALDGLPGNPLPPSIEVVASNPMAADEVRTIAARLSRWPGVRDVDYGREWLDKLEALSRASGAFGAGALAVILGAALVVVANTIRLAVYARRDEIEIMKLVGATDSYVRTPFLLEGAMQGLLGALLAGGAVLVLQHWVLPKAAEAFTFAAGVQGPHLSIAHLFALALAGAVVGLLGSWLAVARFLRA